MEEREGCRNKQDQEKAAPMIKDFSRPPLPPYDIFKLWKYFADYL
jgi:hypothetical protein